MTVINIGVPLDITRAPHVLIAGSTGSGKSVCLHSIITGLLIADPGSEMAFVDMKRIELSGYKHIRQCLGYAAEIAQAENLLLEVLQIMETRYQLMEKYGLKHFPGNSIYLFIDEYADLQTQSKAAEKSICKLARLARAANIHIVLTVQYPTTAVLNTQIKMNLPTRICFKLSRIGSRVVLDHTGAESLQGPGNAIMQAADGSEIRYKNIYVSDETINALIDMNKRT